MSEKFTIVAALFASIWDSQVAMADINIRRVAYSNLSNLNVEVIGQLSDKCALPNTDGWQTNGMDISCINRFVFGSPVPTFHSSDLPKKYTANLAILSLDEISALKGQNPGATFRFEVKVNGTWESKNENLERMLYPQASCTSQERSDEIYSLYTQHFGDSGFWWKNWYNARHQDPSTKKPYYISKEPGVTSFSYVHFFDFKIAECDAPLLFQFGPGNIKKLKFDFLEFNIYVCGTDLKCAEFPDLF